MAYLRQHAEQRGAPATGQLLRYADGRPITSRRYDHLWVRIGRRLPWVATQQISTHWLRHTTLTWVERNFGYAVARAYAGHTDSNSHAGTTATYVRASLPEIAAALAALTGEPYPLAAVSPATAAPLVGPGGRTDPRGAGLDPTGQLAGRLVGAHQPDPGQSHVPPVGGQPDRAGGEPAAQTRASTIEPREPGPRSARLPDRDADQLRRAAARLANPDEYASSEFSAHHGARSCLTEFQARRSPYADQDTIGVS